MPLNAAQQSVSAPVSRVTSASRRKFRRRDQFLVQGDQFGIQFTREPEVTRVVARQLMADRQIEDLFGVDIAKIDIHAPELEQGITQGVPLLGIQARFLPTDIDDFKNNEDRREQFMAVEAR